MEQKSIPCVKWASEISFDPGSSERRRRKKKKKKKKKAKGSSKSYP
jgi:hypothetical protein